MGAWGPGFYSDDETMDIRDDYLDGLRKKQTPEQTLKQMVETFQPDQNAESGYLFWLTIARLQWEYGHLDDDIRRRALDILASGVDQERWKEARAADQRKRKETLAKLEENLRSVNEKPKKLRPYGRKRCPWKVGDVISLWFGIMTHPTLSSEYHAFQDLYGAALVVDIWEEDIGDIYENPVIALYDWIGTEEAQLEILRGISFFQSNMFYKNENRFFWVGDLPLKKDYDRYGLKRIGHLEEYPFSPQEVQGGYRERCIRWLTIEMGIVNHWMEMNREIPKARDR